MSQITVVGLAALVEGCHNLSHMVFQETCQHFSSNEYEYLAAHAKKLRLLGLIFARCMNAQGMNAWVRGCLGERLESVIDESNRAFRYILKPFESGSPSWSKFRKTGDPPAATSDYSGCQHVVPFSGDCETATFKRQKLDNDGEDQAWPQHCPFLEPPPKEVDNPISIVVFSPDGSRLVVCTSGTIATPQILDRSKGLLGELACSPRRPLMKPAFSLDSQLLVLGRSNGLKGIQICGLPGGEHRGPRLFSITVWMFRTFIGSFFCTTKQ